jgi:osomolarity two-component system sensor histidine kinase TcsA
MITALYKDGVHVGFAKISHDLTERKVCELRLIAPYKEREKLKSHLANMNHKIRMSMQGMLSACFLFLDARSCERQRYMAHVMDGSGQVLLQVINDILDYFKLASGSFSINSDIVSIITSVVQGVQPTLQPAMQFELFLAPDLPQSIQGDPLRYHQNLHNLVDNAAKFTDKGSTCVRASIQSEDDGSYVNFTEVTDTGIGISINELAAAGLFTRFAQFILATIKRYKGTGLGLSIAEALAELMGGGIGYRPNPERHGSTF